MKKILVIEDEDNIRSFVVINLKRAGYDVLEAASGEEAFEVLERNRDVVLMLVDLMLPGIAPSEEIVSGPFVLNLKSRTLLKDGARIELTQVEYMIIKTFMENPNRAMSRDEILKTVWGQEYYGDLKIVDVNIRRLRLKIEENAATPKYIGTVWGYGYKWEA